MYRRAVAFVLTITVVLFATLPPVAPVAAAGSWSFSNVLTLGTDGFTQLFSSRIGLDGTVVVHGIRNGQTGIFRIGSTVTTIAEQGVALSEDLGTPTVFQDIQPDPQGRVVFTARITGGTLPASNAFHAFRWTDGSFALMLPDDGSTHLVSGMNSNGEWLTEHISGTPADRTRRYSRTNGLTSTLLLESSEQNVICASERTLPGRGSLSASGQALIYHRHASSPIIEPPPDVGCDTANETQSWQLVRTGSPTETLASGGYQMVNNAVTGTDISFFTQFLINDAGAAAYVLDTYNGTRTGETFPEKLVVRDAAGERVLVDTQGSDFDSIVLVSFNATGQVVLVLSDFEAQESAIFAGPDLQNDRVIGTGEQLFGQTLQRINVVTANAPPSTFGDTRGILFEYSLDDDTTGLALATKGSTRWTNAAGGSWSTAGNWSPEEVPGQSTSVIFGLDASYNVQVGTQRVGRIEVTDGSVGFNGARLTLTGPLQVGNDADLVIPDGSLHPGEISIGHLPPLQVAQPPLARLAVSNQGTTLTTGGPLRIGVASDGQFDLNSGAQATSAETLLGDGSGGTANVRGGTTSWTTGSIDVGKTLTGTLVIESGARVESTSAVVGDATARPDKTIISRASVRGQGSVWNIAQNLNIGLAQSGDVLIENGATLNANELTLGVSENGSDATLTVRGSEGSQRSRLVIAQNAVVGFLGNGLMALLVRDGAFATVGGELVVGDDRGVEGIVSVGGRDAAGNPATLRAMSLNGACIVGRAGPATLTIFDDGLVQCLDVHVGAAAQGNGEVVVDGSAAHPARLAGEFIRVGEAGTGVLNLRGGIVHADVATVIGEHGRLLGEGTIEGSLVTHGSIEPELAPLAPLRLQPAVDVEGAPGTLVVSGTLAFSPTAVLKLDVLGQSPSQYDRVVVTGATNLGGVLRLNFGEGFAPKQGDVFAFVQAGSATGEFEKVELSGLADGFQYELGADGSLTALNDGVPTTQATRRQVYLPLLQR